MDEENKINRILQVLGLNVDNCEPTGNGLLGRMAKIEDKLNPMQFVHKTAAMLTALGVIIAAVVWLVNHVQVTFFMNNLIFTDGSAVTLYYQGVMVCALRCLQAIV
jgi:hypothetical protein